MAAGDARVALEKGDAAGVEAGRRYVEAYVDYIHFVEGVNRLASHGAPQADR